MELVWSADNILSYLVAILLVGVTTILLLFWYSSKKHTYWKDKGIPHVKPVPIFGALLENSKRPLHDIELERYEKYGKIYGSYEGNRPVLSVAEPKLLRQILVKDFHAFTGRRNVVTGDEVIDKMLAIMHGEDWKRVRTIITPTFTTGKIKRMMNIFKDCSRTFVKNLTEVTQKGEFVDVKRLFGAYTMDVIASSAFSTKIDSHNDPNNKFVTVARSAFSRNISWRVILFYLSPTIMKLFNIGIFSPKIGKFFIDVTMQIIEERQKTGQKRNDFLQLLIDTANEASQEGKLDIETEKDIAENYGKEENEQMFKNTYPKKSLTFNELVAQCVMFFLAGYDSTGSTLSFIAYALALNPDVQEKLIQEIDDVATKNDGELTYEAVQSMKYLDNVISETLRLYSPAVRVERTCDEDYKLGDTGITIPKGMVVTIPMYAIHRDPEYFPEPLKFDPDRFKPEERAKRDQYVYLPFSFGPRNCIGMRFALMQLKVCMAYVLSHFRIKKCPKTEIPIKYYAGQIVLQPKSVTLQMEARNNSIKLI